MAIAEQDAALLRHHSEKLDNLRRIGGDALRRFRLKLASPGPEDSLVAIRREASETITSLWPLIEELRKVERFKSRDTEVTSTEGKDG